MPFKFKFECKKCGQCCREAGWVYFLPDDIKRASAYLSMTKAEFKKKYLTNQGGLCVEVTALKPCVFLKDEGCIIHEAKPKQCATFPYWPEYVNKNGEIIDFNRPCPGITILGEV